MHFNIYLSFTLFMKNILLKRKYRKLALYSSLRLSHIICLHKAVKSKAILRVSAELHLRIARDLKIPSQLREHIERH